jgi:photosynthetic reaction center H subunit
MEIGAITGYMYVAQLALYAFWIFFAGLIFYIRREDRREGYPLERDPGGQLHRPNELLMAAPKTFFRPHGAGTYTVPNGRRDARPIAAMRVGNWPGAPMVPTGDPLVDGVGPAAWAERDDRPDMTHDGRLRIVPLSGDPHFMIATGDFDPRGLPVTAADRRQVGTIVDIWIDHAEHLIRYLEVETLGEAPRRILLPHNLARITKRGVTVKSLMSRQFANIPATAAPDRVTLLEEDRIMAYYAGGHLYATPARAEPLL